MVIPGLVEKEINDFYEVQEILKGLYVTNDRDKLSYVHSVVNVSVEKHVVRGVVEGGGVSPPPVSVGRLQFIIMGDMTSPYKDDK